MKRALILMAILALAAVCLFAHGTDSHSILGTVKSIDGDRVTVTTTEEKDVAIALTDETLFMRGAEKASRDDLAAGMRVVVKLTHDNTAAVSVKMPPKK
ncbi:MAG: hypothetical protein ACRD2J_09325 [Thermoanaerobaculia bacterium]